MNAPSPRGRLTRVSEHRLLGGVCAGIASHYNLDLTVVRIVMALLVPFGGTGIVLYVALWVLMPPEDAPTDATTTAEEPATAYAGPGDPLTDNSASHPSGGSAAGAASSAAGSAAGLGTTAEEIAERARRAADELTVAARAAAEAARVAADQLAEVARAATAAGRESWEQQRAQRAPAPPETAPAAEVFASPDRGDMPGTPVASSEIVTADDTDDEERRTQQQQQQQQ